MFNKIIKIEAVEHLNDSYFQIKVNIGKTAMGVRAGQFFEMKLADCFFPMLRKPVSVYDVERENVSFLIKCLGKGTQILHKAKAGDKLDLIGPLGNGFPIAENSMILFVSGGIGYPPMFYLKKKLLAAGNDIFWLHGGRTSEDTFPADEIWTDDGSSGSKGFVTEGLKAGLAKHKPDVIYACGPKAMLKTCAQITKDAGIRLYVSLEEYMACGIGVCHGCAVKVKENSSIGVNYKTVCKDGPVFDADEIDWDSV